MPAETSAEDPQQTEVPIEGYVELNQYVCAGCGECWDRAPEIFQPHETSYLSGPVMRSTVHLEGEPQETDSTVYGRFLREGEIEPARMAALNCPTQAIEARISEEIDYPLVGAKRKMADLREELGLAMESLDHLAVKRRNKSGKKLDLNQGDNGLKVSVLADSSDSVTGLHIDSSAAGDRPRRRVRVNFSEQFGWSRFAGDTYVDKPGPYILAQVQDAEITDGQKEQMDYPAASLDDFGLNPRRLLRQALKLIEDKID